MNQPGNSPSPEPRPADALQPHPRPSRSQHPGKQDRDRLPRLLFGGLLGSLVLPTLAVLAATLYGLVVGDLRFTGVGILACVSLGAVTGALAWALDSGKPWPRVWTWKAYREALRRGVLAYLLIL